MLEMESYFHCDADPDPKHYKIVMCTKPKLFRVHFLGLIKSQKYQNSTLMVFKIRFWPFFAMQYLIGKIKFNFKPTRYPVPTFPKV